jgi:hypothetical protein
VKEGGFPLVSKLFTMFSTKNPAVGLKKAALEIP